MLTWLGARYERVISKNSGIRCKKWELHEKERLIFFEPPSLAAEEGNELDLEYQAVDGCRDAQYDLAMVYIEKSEYIPFKARKLLRKAAFQGHAGAIEKLETVRDQKYPWWS